MSYDIKFRRRAIEYLEKGYSWREATEAFGISSNTLNRWVKKHRETGDLSDVPVKQRNRKISLEGLKAYVAANPDAYQAEIAQEFACTQQAVCSALKRAGITRKKRRNAIESRKLVR